MGASKLNNKLNILGKNIRNLRLSNNFTKAELSRKLELLGIVIYSQDIYRIENGKRTIKDFEVLEFAKIFNVEVNDLYKNVEHFLDL